MGNFRNVFCFYLLIQNVPFKTQPQLLHELLRAQNDETNGNIELLQSNSVAVADALLEIGTAVI
jgi:hypothetical protein